MSGSKSTLTKQRGPAAASLAAPDDEAVSTDEGVALIIAMGGKYQQSRTIKFNKENNKCAKWTHVLFEIFWYLYVLFIGLGTAMELAYVNPGTFLPTNDWLWITLAATAFQFTWFLSAAICATRNAWAVKSGASELPCMELRHTVSWHFVLMGTWVVSMALFVTLYQDNIEKAGNQAFISRIWYTLIVVVVNLLDVVRHISRWALDELLIRCKSPCYDL